MNISFGQTTDLSEVLRAYEGKWVILSDDEKEVIASGNTTEEAINKAIKKGCRKLLLTKVLPFDEAFVPVIVKTK